MIRTATVMDINSVFELSRAFLAEYVTRSSMYQQHQSVMDDLHHLRRLQELVIKWVREDYVLIAYDDTMKPQGVIIAQREKNFWLPEITVLREIIWYVRPDQRRSRLSAELFLRWQKDCDMLKIQGHITTASLTIPEDLDMDLEKRGWQAIEKHWIRG